MTTTCYTLEPWGIASWQNGKQMGAAVGPQASILWGLTKQQVRSLRKHGRCWV